MILTLNAGSSSLKFALYDLDAGADGPAVAAGLFERLGGGGGAFGVTRGGERARVPFAGDHEAAFAHLGGVLREAGWLGGVAAVGHRVVHGGARFGAPVLVDADVEATVAELAVLAPLHNPVNLLGIRLARGLVAAGTPHVAVFDTAFHATLPPHAYRYAVPEDWYREYGVRKYGFHGTSHGYVSAVARRVLAAAHRPHARLVTLHLGNGCSAAAVRDGRCVDTTMGLTPLAGLVMGTRAGDVDPGLAAYLAARGIDVAAQARALNEASGLEGLAGENDMRELLARRDAGDERARLALALFTYRLRKAVGAFAAALGGLDGLVFTAGIGENAAAIRAETCAGLAFLGVGLDAAANERRGGGARIVGEGACAVLVVPTDEERAIAVATRAVARAG